MPSIVLSADERHSILRDGMQAALGGVGAYSCPHLHDDLRFSAWIEGYELGEIKLSEADKPAIDGSERLPYSDT
jgi:hypothetical protein